MSRYYDLVLGLIPVSLLGIAGLLHGFGVALTVAVPVAALVAAALVGHALFVRSPVDSDPTTPADSTPFGAAD